jgi:putative PEP-CTERM system TPR-repeat lipoprotein
MNDATRAMHAGACAKAASSRRRALTLPGKTNAMNVRATLVNFTAIAALCGALMACSGNDPEAMLASAKDYLAKNDAKSAVIQLKNALEKNPDLGEARYLLGRSLLATGDVPAAEKELRRARDLKYPADQVDPALASAWARLGRYQQVVDEMAQAKAATPSGTAELKTAVGQAELGIGKPDLAKAAFAEAHAADAGYAPAYLGDAVLAARDGDFATALAATDKALASAPNLAEALQLKADILLAQGRIDEAITGYRKVLVENPGYLPAHWALVGLLVRENKPADADKALEALKAVAPKHPKTFYYEALVRVSQRNYAAARDAIQQELAMVADDPVGTVLSAAIDFELHDYVHAESTLTKALSRSPQNDYARRLLVSTYLQMRQPGKALETLKPMLGRIDKDPVMQSVAGEVYLQNGDPAQAADYFETAATLDPKAARAKTGLAMTRLAQGDTAAGVKELEAASAVDPGAQPDLMLISVALRRRDWDSALAAIDALEKKQPNQPLAPNLRGLALLGKNDLPGARKSFERALAIDATYFPAVASLARVDLAEHHPDAAQKRFEDFIAKNPKSSQAMLALAEVRAGSGGSKEEVAGLIEKAIKTAPNEVEPRLALVRHYMRSGDPRQAASVAQDALNALPGRADLYDALGQAQQAAGNANEALVAYGRYAEAAPDSPLPYVRMATLHLMARDFSAAADSFRRALAIKPDFVDAQMGLAAIDVGQNKVADALGIATDMQKQRPKEAVGFTLEGDIHAARHDWPKAIAAYRQAMSVAGTTASAAKVHFALSASGQTADADKMAAAWLHDHPADDAFRFALAEQATQRKDYAAAIRYYQQALQNEPDNAVLLNNLAWVAGQVNDPHALEYAERANKIAPDQPRILDTLGVLLVDKGDAKRGVDLLRRAVELAPGLPAIRLNLARALVKTGQPEAAKKELDTLASLGDKFNDQAEVARLRRGL